MAQSSPLSIFKIGFEGDEAKFAEYMKTLTQEQITDTLVAAM